MKKLLLLCFATMCLFQTALFGQEKSISGKVTDATDGSGLPSVNIVVKGTTTGTITDVEGNYKITVPADAKVLVFSYTGYATQEIEIGNQSVIDVKLATDDKILEEVVVTALGLEKSEKSLGYSVENVSAAKIQQVSEPDPLRALQGKVAGVNIQGSSGIAGSATRITIRGNASLLGETQPLFVVDGVPYDNSQNGTSNQLTGGGAYSSRMADLDPNNIASITVLKGGAAAALYGIRAGKGVVVITTKSGSGKASKKGLEITYNSSLSFEKIANIPDYQNKYGTGTNFNYGAVNGSWGAEFGTLDGKGAPDPTMSQPDSIPLWAEYEQAFPDRKGSFVPYRAYPNNVKDFFKTGTVYENSVTVTGGNEKANISVIASTLRQDGYIPEVQFKRTNLSLGGNTILSNKLRVGGNFAYTTTLQRGPQMGASNATGNASLFGRLLYPGRSWDMTGMPYTNPLTRGSVFFVNRQQAVNPYWSVKNDGVNSDVDRIVASTNLGYDVSDWLSFNYKLGINTYSQKNTEFFRPGSRGGSGVGQVTEDFINFTEVESNFLIQMKKDFSEKLKLNVTLGHNINQRTSKRQAYQGTGMVVFDIIDVDNTNNVVPFGGGYSRRRLYGVFGEASLAYNDYLFLTVTGRNDWSSTLPKVNRSFFYPSANLAFVFTDALKMKSKILSSGKVRMGVSSAGNDAGPYSLFSVYDVNPTLATGASANTFPFLGTPGATLEDGLYDPNLKPEFVKEFEIGTQLNFFEGRVNFDFAYYNKNTTDNILNVSIPSSTGFSSFLTNAGKLRNSGVEMSLDVTPIQLKNGFSWNIYTTFTHNRSLVVSLADGIDELVLRSGFAGDVSAVHRPGQEFGLLRGTVSAKDDEGNLLINPTNGELIALPNPQIVGNPNPNYMVGVTNSFSFKGIRLSAVLDYRDGGDLYSNSTQLMLGRGVLKETEDRERGAIIPGVLGNPNTYEPIRDLEGNKIKNTRMIETNALYFGQSFAVNGTNEWSVFDATVIRLREISLAYDFPKTLLEKTPFGSITLSASGRNLFYRAPNFPKSANYDPEVSAFGTSSATGFEFASAPSVKRYGLSLRATF